MKLRALLAAIVAGLLLAWIAGARVLRGGMAVDDRWASAEFEQRLPRGGENESATRLLATAERLGDFHEVRPALRDYLRGKTPSPAVAQFLDSHANVIRTLRAEIISNPPPVWAIDAGNILDPPRPPLSLHLQLFTIFGADALMQHEHGNDRAAQSDLRVVSILSRSLRQRPEADALMIAMIGNRIVRQLAATVGGESDAFDIRPPLLRAIEYEAWAMRARAERFPAGEPDGSRLDDTIRRVATPFVRPIRVMQMELAMSKMRRMAASVARTPPCAPLPMPEMPEWAPLFERINRLRPSPSECAELATANHQQ